jgi:preprotein translocase subunit SecG
MLETIFMVLFLLTAVILSLLVLIQRGRGGGLAGAFGGPGGHSAFGTKTADVFTKATAVLGAIFFALAIVTAYFMRNEAPRSIPVVEPTAPASAPAAPGGAAAPAGTGGAAAPAAPAGGGSSAPAK